MATKKPKLKKVYTVLKKNWRGNMEEGKRIWKRKHDAARKALVEGGSIVEYELVKTGEFLIVAGQDEEVAYVPKTPEAELLYGKD